jgi:hypothetical protein
MKPIRGILPVCCAATTGAARAPASEVSRKRRRSMPGWWGGYARRSTSRRCGHELEEAERGAEEGEPVIGHGSRISSEPAGVI